MGATKSKKALNSEELLYVMKQTDLDAKTINEWYGGFMSDCPTGKMTPSHFSHMYKMLIPSGDTEKFCKHVFRTFDTDNNGYIDFIEFLLAVNVTSTGSAEEKLKWAFKLYDIDGNGSISQQEMTKVVKSIYAMLGPRTTESDSSAVEKAKAVFISLDTDGNSVLSEKEFVNGCLSNEDFKALLAPIMISNAGSRRASLSTDI